MEGFSPPVTAGLRQFGDQAADETELPAKPPQQAVQRIGASVNVADEIVSMFDQSLIFLLKAESSAVLG